MDPYNPTDLSGGRILRGGGLNTSNPRLSVYNRQATAADSKGRAFGFRVVVTVK